MISDFFFKLICKFDFNNDQTTKIMKKPSLIKVQSQMNNVLNNKKKVFKNLFCCNKRGEFVANQTSSSISFDGEFINVSLFKHRWTSIQDFEMF